MNTNHQSQQHTAENAVENHIARDKQSSLSYRLFSTNWGLVIIGGLLAFAIGIATLHNGYVESRAENVPEVEAETIVSPSVS